MRRALIHYWRMNLAVVAATAVATAVLAGALLVGDSVRGSLRQLTLERLGDIDYALAGQRFFSQKTASELAELESFDRYFAQVAPAIVLQSSAQHAEKRTRASNVGLQGISAEFLELFDEDGAGFFPEEGTIFPPAVINESLQQSLQAEVGDAILVSLKRWSDVPSSSLLGRKDTASVVASVRLEVARVLPDRGLGRFSLTTHQSAPYNVFVPLEALQKALDQESTVNSLLVAQKDGDEDHSTELHDALRSVLEVDDLGLQIVPSENILTLESDEFILKPAVISAVEQFAEAKNLPTLPILTYLANSLSSSQGSVPYSTVTATDTAGRDFGALRLVDGTEAPDLAEDEILLNSWAAEDLAAKVGDTIEIDYFEVDPRENLHEAKASFTVRGVVTIEGLAADESLSQEYPGIAGSATMAEWDPPFPIDLGEIRARDEEYWDLYRGTPKAFVSTEKGKELWSNRWGDLTALRIAVAEGDSPDEVSRDLTGHLIESLPLDAYGMVFQPVKSLGLAASVGANNYSGYFIGFSFFLIASAAMLVSLLFGLGVEQRASEIGLLQAVGYRERQVRRGLLAEGLTLAMVGALIGLGGAIGYAALMMVALRTWWRPAFGTSELYLHVTPASLVAGYVLALLVVLFTIWRRIRRLREVPTTRLLKNVSEPTATRAGGRARWTAGVALTLAALLIVYAFASGETRNAAIFALAGPALLVGLLAAFSLMLGGSSGRLERPGPQAILRMAVANGARNRNRSILSATLVASASFMIVTVAAFHEDFSHKDFGKDSGTGGFALVAESDVPLQRDLDSPDGRFELGFDDSHEELLAATKIFPLKLLPGDDTSCLNLYQPRDPRVVGIPPEMVERGGFLFQGLVEERDEPWQLLQEELGEGVIPAFGDFNSTQWILKLKLGEELEIKGSNGEPLRLRLVGNLATSIFQSELLISRQNFDRYFPDLEGSSIFLVETDSATQDEVTRVLESSLADYGLDVMSSVEKLAAFHEVQNTFLSTFRTLGGLGLLLGTVGLAIVLFRNVIERRSELAALRAFGYRRQLLKWLILLENGLLLVAGLAIGTTAALVTAGPHLIAEGTHVPWQQILTTLTVILGFGLLACAVAATGALRVPLLPALKADR